MEESLAAKMAMATAPAPVWPAEASTPVYSPAAWTARVHRFFRFLRQYWWVPVLSLALSAGAAVAYLLVVPATFISTSVMWETEKLRLPEGAAFAPELQNYLGTQIELLRSDKLREMAVRRVRSAEPEVNARDKHTMPIRVKLKVRQAPRSTVLVLEARSPDSGYARIFLDALMTEYLEYKKAMHRSVSGDTLASISEQVLRLERELHHDQEALTTFEQTNNLAILEEEGKIAGGYLARLKTQLSDVNLEAKLLEAIASEQDLAIARKTNTGFLFFAPSRGLDRAPSAVGATEPQTAFKELEVLRIQRETLSKYLKPKHPKIVKLDESIDRSQRLLAMYQNQSRDQLASSRQALKIRVESIQASIKDWEAKVVGANSRIAQAERLKLNANRTQSLYDRLILMLQNVGLSRSVDQDSLAVLEQASPDRRSYRMELTVSALALIFGLVFGIAIVSWLELRDDRFISLAEVFEQLTDDIVGQVPELPRADRHQPVPLVKSNDGRQAYVESYRNLRSALLFLPANGPPPKVLLITSALPSEGKSTIAANLARVLALGGSRVLLVDGDLRQGRLNETIGLKVKPGLAELLSQARVPARVIQTDSLPNFYFVSRGGGSSDPGDLFLSPQLPRVLNRWRRQFDYVLVDSSPVLGANDTTTLAPKVDGVLFVVRRRLAPVGAVREALDGLTRRHAKVLGVIFTWAEPSVRSRAYYRDSGFHPPLFK